MSEFKVGDRAVAKVGRNEINVEILAVEEKSYLVRNNAGKEFHAVRLIALPDAKGVGNTDTIAAALSRGFEVAAHRYTGVPSPRVQAA